MTLRGEGSPGGDQHCPSGRGATTGCDDGAQSVDAEHREVSGRAIRVYFDRNATMSGAKRRGSAGMDRRPNAAWVSPQADRGGLTHERRRRGSRGPGPRHRSEDWRSQPSPRFFAVSDGSFAACGRDAGLKGSTGRTAQRSWCEHRRCRPGSAAPSDRRSVMFRLPWTPVPRPILGCGLRVRGLRVREPLTKMGAGR